MLTSIWVVVAVTLAVLPGLGFAQVMADEPIKMTLCDLVKEPERFNGKMVQVRAAVFTGFEKSILGDQSCSADIWLSVGAEPALGKLEYAYIESIVDIRTPERLEWKPLLPLRSVVLKEDKAYRRLYRYLGKQFRPKDRHTTCIDCPLYTVSATMIGRFDHSETKLIATRGYPEGKIGVGSVRFGHLGAWDSQLVLKSVSDVVAKPIDPSVYGKK
jgi:hypothetical protein